MTTIFHAICFCSALYFSVRLIFSDSWPIYVESWFRHKSGIEKNLKAAHHANLERKAELYVRCFYCYSRNQGYSGFSGEHDPNCLGCFLREKKGDNFLDSSSGDGFFS